MPFLPPYGSPPTPDASATKKGKVELATIAETNTGTDATKAVTPDGLTGWTGSAQIVTTGALDSGSITSGFGSIDIGTNTLIAGNIESGVADTTQGLITVHGSGSGSSEGGEIRLGIAADHDTSFGFWRIDIFEDDLRLGLEGQTQVTFDADGINLSSGDDYSINGTSVLSATTLGSGVTASSLTSVGTITSGTWEGTTIAVDRGGTGATTLGDGYVLLGSGTGAITALDVTAKGSLLVGDGTTDPVALAVGANDTVLTADSSEASGTKWATVTATETSSVLDIDVSTATVSNTTTETTVYSFSVPGGTLGTGNALRFRGAMDFTTNSGSIQLRLKYGSTTIVPLGTFAQDSNGSFLEALLKADGATNSQQAVFFYTHTSSGGDKGNKGTAAEDSTGALTFSITVEFSDASASNVFNLFTGVLEKLTT